MDKKELENIVLSKGCYSPEENARIYNKFFRNWLENHLYIYRRFGLKSSLKILDIGCGPGHNLIHFSPESMGIEVNEKLASFGRGLGLNIISFNIEDGRVRDEWPEIDSDFDLIWCSDFVIHLVSPFRMLYKARNYLKENGRLVIQIPQSSWLGTYKNSQHLYAFDKRSLAYLLEVAGYKPINFSGYVRTLPNFVNKLSELFLQKLGPNIWILADRKKQAELSAKTFLPAWF